MKLAHANLSEAQGSAVLGKHCTLGQVVEVGHHQLGIKLRLEGLLHVVASLNRRVLTLGTLCTNTWLGQPSSMYWYAAAPCMLTNKMGRGLQRKMAAASTRFANRLYLDQAVLVRVVEKGDAVA